MTNTTCRPSKKQIQRDLDHAWNMLHQAQAGRNIIISQENDVALWKRKIKQHEDELNG